MTFDNFEQNDNQKLAISQKNLYKSKRRTSNRRVVELQS